MKISHAIRFILGDARGMRRSIERVMPAYGQDHAARGYLLGCHAFTLEETGDYDRAELAGRAGAGDCARRRMGAARGGACLRHDGRAPDAGIALIEGREAAWAHCNNFRYHVWWHKALMHLDLGETDTVLELYDTQIRADKTDDYRDISNATSLLMRLELEGVDVGDRWDELAGSPRNAHRGWLPDLRRSALPSGPVGGRREARPNAMTARIRRDAQAHGRYGARGWRIPGLAALPGSKPLAKGDYATAFRASGCTPAHMQTGRRQSRPTRCV